MKTKNSIILLLLSIALSSSQCPRTPDKAILSKIEFDYSRIDDDGLNRGEVAIDYEFCIPAEDHHLHEVLAIDEDARVMKSSKGRIGCTSQQWLCILSTHHPKWKERLYAIASLPYVERILQTFYE